MVSFNNSSFQPYSRQQKEKIPTPPSPPDEIPQTPIEGEEHISPELYGTPRRINVSNNSNYNQTFEAHGLPMWFNIKNSLAGINFTNADGNDNVVIDQMNSFNSIVGVTTTEFDDSVRTGKIHDSFAVVNLAEGNDHAIVDLGLIRNSEIRLDGSDGHDSLYFEGNHITGSDNWTASYDPTLNMIRLRTYAL